MSNANERHWRDSTRAIHSGEALHDPGEPRGPRCAPTGGNPRAKGTGEWTAHVKIYLLARVSMLGSCQPTPAGTGRKCSTARTSPHAQFPPVSRI